MTIGKRIAQLRKIRGMTQTELGAVCGDKKQNIYKYEAGIITNIPLEKIELIAHALDVSPCCLMGWEKSDGEKLLLPDEAEAKKVAEDYLTLDPWGRQTVRSVIDHEKARCKSQRAEEVRQVEDKVVYNQNLSEKGPAAQASSLKESGAV